ncbi:hypothetical protein GFK26_31255 [Variovorax paradoxus]|uniref:Phospholipase C accessory protein PlcR n=1 Tax=Variovorax paradoxus TaxID=34073 RepID=A0A5Q0ME41_VARPD|nr:hypothetical protein [Variovorax paradoxus]QFZ86934.1 hypothetical protein GFK26_31255 [Variovorax paradoxus]
MRSRLSTSARLGLGAATLLTALGAWFFFADPDSHAATRDTAAAAAASAHAQAAPREGVVLARRAPVYTPFAPGASPYQTSAGARERGLDLVQLRRDLAGTGKDVAQEVDRIVALARFRDRINTLAQMLPNLGDEERRDESYAILEQLPRHVANGEILPVEAIASTRALIQIGEPDPTIRDALTKQLTESLQAHARQKVGPAPTTEPRYQSYTQARNQMAGEVQASVQDPDERQRVMARRELEIRSRHY